MNEFPKTSTMEISNWILKKHIQNISIVSEEYLPFFKDFVSNKGVIVNDDFSKVNSFINWNKYPKHYNFFYDYEGCEIEVKDFLLKSSLVNANNLVMDFGYHGPVIKIETNYFINNWYDFINGAHYETLIVSDDGKLFFECVKGYFLLSNFPIKPSCGFGSVYGLIINGSQ